MARCSRAKSPLASAPASPELKSAVAALAMSIADCCHATSPLRTRAAASGEAAFWTSRAN
eukprot:scaffold114433_cov24-Tisochrysis_lutea.AAC.4